MWPHLFDGGWVGIAVPTYGFLVALAVLAGVGLGVWLAARDGLDPVVVFRGGWVVLGVSFVGMRLMWVVNSSEPVGVVEALALDAGGSVFYGGLLAGLAAGLFVARACGIDWWRGADAAAPAIALGLAIGRVGCFMAGCCGGSVCSAPWGVTYPAETALRTGAPLGIPVHPVQLYEAAMAGVIAVALTWVHRRRAFPGQVLLGFLLLYPAARFALERWRADERGDLFGLAAATGLSPAQIISIALVACALTAWALRRPCSSPRAHCS